jgi:hypothetical protein
MSREMSGQQVSVKVDYVCGWVKRCMGDPGDWGKRWKDDRYRVVFRAGTGDARVEEHFSFASTSVDDAIKVATVLQISRWLCQLGAMDLYTTVNVDDLGEGPAINPEKMHQAIKIVALDCMILAEHFVHRKHGLPMTPQVDGIFTRLAEVNGDPGFAAEIRQCMKRLIKGVEGEGQDNLRLFMTFGFVANFLDRPSDHNVMTVETIALPKEVLSEMTTEQMQLVGDGVFRYGSSRVVAH